MQFNEARSLPLHRRVYGVWYRHSRVFKRSFGTTALSVVLDPLLYLGAFGLGLGRYVPPVDGMPYVTFLATALPVTAAMFAGASECTYGTFVRLEFAKTYDSMLAAPVAIRDVFVGELLWAGTKGMLFAASVATLMALTGVVPYRTVIIAPLVGFMMAVAAGALSLLVTSFVKEMSAFGVYFTCVISPMYFFSNTVFPTASLPAAFRQLTEVLPLTHAVRLNRALSLRSYDGALIGDLLYLVFLMALVGYVAVSRLRRRLVS